MQRIDDQLDDLIAFILARAAREDDWDRRSLGMIHLIKYAYLADLYAAEAGREPVTRAPWVFFHFGPWDAGLHQRIEGSLERIGATRSVVPSRFGDDRNSWRWNRDLEPEEEIRKRIPASIRVRLPQDIHRFANDTAMLLDHVYRTPPMLRAAPRERLSFVPEVEPSVAPELPLLAMDSGPTVEYDPSSTQSHRKREKKAQKSRLAIAERLAKWRAERAESEATEVSEPAPRYDDVFRNGSAWLDSLAGQTPTSTSGTLTVDPAVWHSLARRGVEHD